MDVTVRIPDDIAADLLQNGVDLSRRALESFALEDFALVAFPKCISVECLI